MSHKPIGKFAAVAVIATALAVAPLTPAHAEGWHHGGGWHGGGLFWPIVAAGAVVTGAAVAIATAPFHLVADVAAPPPPPRPVYYAPAPAYYGYAPGYYHPRQVVYSYPQPYGYGYR